MEQQTLSTGLNLDIGINTQSLEEGLSKIVSLLNRIATAMNNTKDKQEKLNKSMADTGKVQAAVKHSADVIGVLEKGMDALSIMTNDTSHSFDGFLSALTGVTDGLGKGAAAGLTFGNVFVGLATFGLDLFINYLSSIKEAEQERQQVFEAAVSNMQKYGDTLASVERNMAVLRDSSSSVEELVEARNSLAESLEGVTVGYDEEGNAILTGNAILQERVDVLKEQLALNQQQVSFSLGGKKFDLAENKEALEQKEKEVQKKQEELDEQVRYNEKLRSQGTHFVSDVPIYDTQNSLQKSQEEMAALKEKEIQLEREIREAFTATVQVRLEGYNDMSAVQQSVVNQIISENEGLIESENGVNEVLAIISDQLADRAGALEYVQSCEEMAQANEKIRAGVSDDLNSLQSLSSAYQTLQQDGSLSAEALYNLGQAFPEINSYIAASGDLSLQNGQLLVDLFNAKMTMQNLERESQIATLETQRQTAVEERRNLMDKAQAYDTLADAAINAAVQQQIEASNGKIEDIDKTIDALRTASKITSGITFESLRSGGGNSGSSKPKSYGSSKNEALQNEIKLLEQKKKMDQVTNEEELAWLERMLGQYRMSAEERQDLEYRIYSVKKKLQDEEEKRLQQQIKQLDELGSAVTSALKARYEEQKEIEQKRIDDSIQSWKDWEEQTVAAIQGQIDALDELEEEQESADKRAEYERNKQALELQKAYEKDLYQREMIQKEINRLDKEEQKRLEQEARDELRKQLEQQIEDAKEQSKQKQEALEKESEALDETYEKLMQDSALKAEAERMLMQASQEDILQLLQSYAPDYEVVGQSMGEKLVEGFTQKVGSIEDYFNRMQAQLDAFHSAVADTANQAADHFYANRAAQEAKIASQAAPSNIQMTVNFNQPVESPIETRRELERAMQSMVVKIQQGG